MDFFSGLWGYVTGSTIASSLGRIALLGFASKLLGGTVDPTGSKDKEIVDKGVRLQLDPSTDNQIPILYGEAYFGGYITDAQISADYKKMTYCLTLAEVTGNTISGSASTYTFNNVYFNKNRVVFKADGVTVDYTLDSSGNQDISARDLIKVYFYKGTTPIQPSGSSGTTPASHTVMPGWTSSTHPMTGLLYAIVEVTYNQSQNVTGLPDCTFRVTNSMSNPGDVLNDYMKSDVYGAGIHSTEIDSTSLTALNSYSSTGFTYTTKTNTSATSSIKINGLVDTATSCLTNMEALAEAASSWMTYDIYSGKWTVVINRAGTSVASLNDSNIVNEISISGTSLTQLNNVVNVKYQNTDILDNTDFVKITLPSGDWYQNEPENSLELDLPFTNKQVVAAKIGLQALKQGRVDKIISFKTDYSYILLRAGDIIDVTSTVFGFTNKLFRIITATETEGNNGEILIEFKCLEYDAAVYDYDITEFDVETDSGILSIGSIGKPNVPTVTKTESANVPKIVIDAQVPSGIVNAMEYWITFDTAIATDSARTYIKIGTFSNTNGTNLTEDDVVSYTYSGLSQSDFYVKVKGVNNFSSGPYSDPTGLIAYVPIVVADTLTPDPISIGGILTSLGGLALLGEINKLLGSGGKSILDTLLDTFFPDRTGADTSVADLLRQDTAFTSQLAGDINNLNNISIDELLDVDTTTTAPSVNDKLIWDGENWVPGGGDEASATITAWARITIEDDINIVIDNSFNIGNVKIDDTEDTPSVSKLKIEFTTANSGNGYVVLANKGENTSTSATGDAYDIYDQKTDSFKLAGATTGAVIHLVVIGTGGITSPCILSHSSKFPTDRNDKENPMTNTDGDKVAIDVVPEMTFGTSSVYSLNKGTGKARLYKSNGTLVEMMPGSNVTIEGNVVKFPFATLTYGTDYYILLEKNVVYGINDGVTCYNKAISSPLIWNFHTVTKEDPPTKTRPTPSNSSKTATAPSFKPVPATCISLKYTNLVTQSKMTDHNNNDKVDLESNIKLVFNNPISFGQTGKITIKKIGIINTTHQEFDIAQSFKNAKISELFWIDNKTLVLNSTKDFDPNTEYCVLMDPNVVYDSCGINGNARISDTTVIRWKTDAGPTPVTATGAPAT